MPHWHSPVDGPLPAPKRGGTAPWRVVAPASQICFRTGRRPPIAHLGLWGALAGCGWAGRRCLRAEGRGGTCAGGGGCTVLALFCWSFIDRSQRAQKQRWGEGLARGWLGEVCCEIEAGRAPAELYAPVAGRKRLELGWKGADGRNAAAPATVARCANQWRTSCLLLARKHGMQPQTDLHEQHAVDGKQASSCRDCASCRRRPAETKVPLVHIEQYLKSRRINKLHKEAERQHEKQCCRAPGGRPPVRLHAQPQHWLLPPRCRIPTSLTLSAGRQTAAACPRSNTCTHQRGRRGGGGWGGGGGGYKGGSSFHAAASGAFGNGGGRMAE